MTPFFCSFLLIDFAVKLNVLYLLTFEQMNNKRILKSREKIWKSLC